MNNSGRGARENAWSRTAAKRLYYREPFSNLPVLAERDWRFSVVEDDSFSGPPKSKPLIGATLGAAQ